MAPNTFTAEGWLLFHLGTHVSDDTTYDLARCCRVVALAANPQ
jgi:hypothetical protein